MADETELIPGIVPRPDGSASIAVWAPENGARVAIRTVEGRVIPLDRDGEWHLGHARGLGPGTRYHVVLDGEPGPDPASRSQPEGLFGPSEVVDPRFDWSDGDWRGVPLEDLVLYELHVGTFTKKGTLDAVIDRLDHLVALGVTCVELLPVCPFPGRWNWGYDGVFPFAVHAGYGGPDALRRLVDACHARGLSVCLDVVYNHLGPLGNHWYRFGPIFTDRYHGPWGDVPNFDQAYSDGVRRFLIASAEEWVRTYHIDALRLDAVHGIVDTSPVPFFAELTDRVRRVGRDVLVIAESDLGDPRVVRPRERGGWGCDAQWADDLHHALHVTLTREQHSYYEDFGGGAARVAEALRDSYLYKGQYSAFRRRRHGADPTDIEPLRFVGYLQNHDQVGNRAAGDRLSEMLPPEALRAALALVLLGGHTPLLFQGEEWGTRKPFPYFTDHPDPDLAQAVREGRQREFDHAEEVPDPQAEATFCSAILDWDELADPEHAAHLAAVHALIRIRRTLPPVSRSELRVACVHDVVTVHRGQGLFVVAHLADDDAEVELDAPRGYKLVHGSPGMPSETRTRWKLGPWALGVYGAA